MEVSVAAGAAGPAHVMSRAQPGHGGAPVGGAQSSGAQSSGAQSRGAQSSGAQSSGAQSRGAPAPADRRERKKQQLRDALIEAALTLFEAKGYEHTAVREITDAVDVSERTFFRYFASKEDLALSFLKDRLDSFLSALEDRPPEEEPLAAVRNAFHDSLHGLTGSAHGGVAPYLSVIRLMDGSPGLLAANLRYLHDHEDEIVGVLARREGVDPATDRRPRLMAALFGTIAYLANTEWTDNRAAGPDALAAAFDAYADQLMPALAGHWRRGTVRTPAPAPGAVTR